MRWGFGVTDVQGHTGQSKRAEIQRRYRRRKKEGRRVIGRFSISEEAIAGLVQQGLMDVSETESDDTLLMAVERITDWAAGVDTGPIPELRIADQIISQLADEIDDLGDSLSAVDLWPQFYSALDQEGLFPQEEGGAATNDDSVITWEEKPKGLTFKDFKKQLYNERKRHK